MLAFLMDQHIRIEITEGLRRRGIDVLTAFEDGSDRLEDDNLLARATSLNRILVSQDQDLLNIAPLWQRTGREFCGIVFAIQQDIDIGGTIEYLELFAHAMSAEEIHNREVYIPTRR